jgi:HSP20 family protein
MTLAQPLLASMDELFDRMWSWSPATGSRVTGFVPLLDVTEADDRYLVHVDLPGVKKEDVSVELQGGLLTISGVRTPIESGTAQRQERPYGAFMRSLTLPDGIDADAITADYVDGVLALTLPKPESSKPKKIAVNGGQKQLTQ